MTDPAGVVDRLVASREPYLVGVRHHSPALAAVLPALLEEADPQVLAVELPSQARGWLGWLTHPRARAPLALAFSHEGDMAFYPMADFSPELVALRWARDHGVEVDCIDLPVGAAPPEDPGGLKVEDEEGTRSGELGGALWQALARRARARTEDAEEIWDRLVEAHAPGSTPGQVRERLDEVLTGQAGGLAGLSPVLVGAADFLAALAAGSGATWIESESDELAYQVTRRDSALLATADELRQAAGRARAGTLD